MKKITTTLLLVLITSVTIFAQAVLPIAPWGFTGSALPATGWVSAGTGFSYYTGSGNPAPAAKFSATGDMLTISFTSTPGTLTFDATDNPPTGGTYSSNFTVQESADNITYTTVGTPFTTQANFGATAGTYYSFSNVLLGTSRYVRFNLITKAVGNIGLDNVGITAGVSATQQMVVMQAATTIVNGGTYTVGSPVATALPINFTIDNTGTTGTLNVTSAVLSGPAMADYVVNTSTPITIAGSGNSPLSITFTPSAAGTRNAILTMANNDPTNNPYVINLNGIGGTLATEPTAQPSGLTFAVNKQYRVVATFTAAAGAPDGYVVLRSDGAAVSGVPVDGTVYQQGDMIGNAKVVMSSNATGFMPNNIKSSTQYFFAVFSYNGVGTFRNYLTTSPLTGNTTTPGANPGTYYAAINTSSTTFVTDLHTLINPHTQQYYSSYGPLMMDYLYQRDTAGGKHVATCQYSGENIVYTGLFDWTTNNMSREHTYPQSWMPTVNGAGYLNSNEYQDYHMLLPVDQTNANAIRSNYPYGVVVSPSYTYMGCKLGLNAAGKTVWEPRDAEKGAAARSMLYECIAYTGTGVNGNTNTTYDGSWSLPAVCYNPGVVYPQDQAVLKQWSTAYPPDKFEIAKNEFVDSLQGNRNPFIDHPEYLCFINFDSMTYIHNGCTVGIAEYTNDASVSLSPNPNNGNFTINYTGSENKQLNLKLFDMMGRVIFSKEVRVNDGINKIEMNIPEVSKGIYSLEFITETGIETKRVVIQ